MAEYIVNDVGSSNMNFNELAIGDSYLLNTTTQSQKGIIHEHTLKPGIYEIEVAGGRGGNGAGRGTPGKGAKLKFKVNIFEESIFNCLVGCYGGNSSNNSSNGGGGTFLVLNNILLATAGGGGGYGGGRGTPTSSTAGGNATTDILPETINGIPIPSLENGGYTGYLSSDGGGGGGGYTGNGGSKVSNSGTGGLSYKNGGNGGASRDSKSYGGFGGGGGCHEDYGGGGGGGGYTGGSGGYKSGSNYYGGFGGSSYINESIVTEIVATSDGKYKKNSLYNGIQILTSSFNDGNGYCRITLLKDINNLKAHCKIDGTIREVDKMSVKVDGAWKEVDSVYIKVDGNWKKSE